MKTQRYFSIISLCLALMILFSISFSAFAVVVEPSRHEITVSAGTTTQVSFSLINNTSEIMNIASLVKPYFPLATETAIPPEKDSPNAIKSCETWITPELDSVQVNPGESKEFSLSIQVPEKASGEYAAYISFDQSGDVDDSQIQKLLDNETQEAITGMEIDLVLRRSVPIYLFIDKTTEINAEIVDATSTDMSTEEITESNFDYINNYIKIAAILKNTGSRHIRAQGSIVLLDETGNLIDTLPTGITWPILPGYTETIPVYWKSPKKSATYLAIINIELGDDIILQHELKFSVDEKGFLVQ